MLEPASRTSRVCSARAPGLIRPPLIGSKPGLAIADDLVGEEGRQLDSIVDLGLADEGELHSPGKQAYDHLVRRGDLDLDVHVRMVAPEAAERVRAGDRRPASSRRRCGSCPASSPASAPSSSSPACKRCERLARPRGEQAARLGEPAAAPVALDQALPRRGLEQAQVLARGRLADADAACSCRHSSLPLDLDEQTEPGGVPEERERCIGQGDGRYRKIRLAQY